MIITKQIIYGSEAYQDMLALRNEVLRKPINWPYFELGNTQHEAEFILLGAYNQQQALVACCILAEKTPNEVQLKQMAVLPNQQGKGTGAQLLHHAEIIALQKGYKKVSMHARQTALRFYQKCNYVSIGGIFEEVGIPHFKMEKVLHPQTE